MEMAPYPAGDSLHYSSILRHCLAAANEDLRNSFMSFSISSDALRARVPAALLPFSACAAASFANEAYAASIFSISSFIL